MKYRKVVVLEVKNPIIINRLHLFPIFIGTILHWSE